MVGLFARHMPFIGRWRYLLLDRHYNRTIRISLVVLCLVFTAMSAIMLRQFNANDPFSILRQLAVIIFVGGITAAAWVYRNIEAPALVVLIVTTVLHDGISTGTDTKITFTFFLLYLWLGIWLFKFVVVERRLKLQPAYTNIPLGLFLGALAISFIWSSTFVEEQVGYLYADKIIPRLMTGLVIVISPLTSLLYANNVTSEKMLKRLVWWLIGVGVVFGVLRFVTGSVPEPLNDKGQFPAWVTALMLGQLLFNNKLSWKIRAVLVVGVLVWLQEMLGLGITWLSGWVPLFVVAMILVFFRSRKAVLVLALLIVIYGVVKVDDIRNTLNAEEGESGSTRALSWQRTFAVTGDHFFLGTGPAGYHFYFTAYGYYELGGIGSFNLSHNNYVDIMAQTGVVGFMMWIVFWGAQGLNVLRLWRTPAPSSFLKGTKYALVACYPAILITMMLGDWITPFPYTQTLAGLDYTIWAWILTGLTVATYHIMAKQNAEQALQQTAAV
ncbi:MAG: O-antigen ligase family protein [Anaerolineae bacterium]